MSVNWRVGGWRKGAEGDKQGGLGGLLRQALGEMRCICVVISMWLRTRQTAEAGWEAKSIF